MVADGAFSHKIDYVTRASKLLNWFKSYSDLNELVDFAYWWSFIRKGSAPAACAAGLFFVNDKYPHVSYAIKKFIYE